MSESWMKRGFYLGLGAAISGKERFEKMVQEMVDKGEMTPKEARSVMDEWMEKGEAAEKERSDQTRAMMKERVKELGFVPEEDYRELEARVARLERLHKEQNE